MNTKVSAGFNLFDPNPKKTVRQDWGSERLAKLARGSSVSPERQRIVNGAINGKSSIRESINGVKPYQRAGKLQQSNGYGSHPRAQQKSEFDKMLEAQKLRDIRNHKSEFTKIMQAQKRRDFKNRSEFQKLFDAQKERDLRKKQPVKQLQKKVPQKQIIEKIEVKPQLKELNEYTVTLQIKLEVKFGESLMIVGNIPELGQWQDHKTLGKMTWSDGHLWQVTLKIKRANAIFQYKYVKVSHHKKDWEQGYNRVGDLYLLHQEQSGVSNLVLTDIWESYTVNFSIYYPLDEELEHMRVNGEGRQLGAWNKGQGPIKMAIAEKEVVWLTGMKVKPWEHFVTFNQLECPKHICYKYSIRNDQKDNAVWEREPSRYIIIQNPEEIPYTGELGKQGSNQWKNVDKVYLVNGHIEKADANFVGSLNFDKIGDTGIFLGQYPQTEEDVAKLHEAGITGIFNVQTDIDIAHRGINWPKMINLYQAKGISAVHFPIHDFNEWDLTSKLFDAAVTLNDMINKRGLVVYVHCTAGMGRAPASVLVYLCLFKKLQCWANPTEVDLYVKSFRKVSVPNMRAVYKVVEENKNFQNQQRESFTDLPSSCDFEKQTEELLNNVPKQAQMTRKNSKLRNFDKQRLR